MLTKKPKNIVGFVRATPRHAVQEQQRLMVLHGVFKVYDDIDLCIRQRRKNNGDVVAVTRLVVLADPRRRTTKGGMRQSLLDTVAAIEAAGATLVELTTERRRDDPVVREAMLLDAINELSRTRRGANKIGRPPRVWTDEQLTIMRMHWFDHANHATNDSAVRAINADGVTATASQIVKKLGPSKRAAGNPKTRGLRKAERAAADRVVYFIQSDAPGFPIKIGVASDARRRLSTLQVSSHAKLNLLGTIPGDEGVEWKLHRRFARHHLSGEWFAPNGNLAEYIKRFTKGGKER